MGFLHVARGAVAQFDDVFAFGLHRKMGVEGRDAVDPRRRNADAGGHIADHVLREIFVDRLNLLEDRNELGFRIIVFLQNLVHRGEVFDHRLRGFHGFLHVRSLTIDLGDCMVNLKTNRKKLTPAAPRRRICGSS